MTNWTKSDLVELTVKALEQAYYCSNCLVISVTEQEEYCVGCSNEVANEICEALAIRFSEQLLVERGLY